MDCVLPVELNRTSAIGSDSIELIETVEGFEKLREEWSQLLETSDSRCFFLTWEWLYTWWKHLSNNRSLFLLTVRSGEDLVAIVPLARKPPSFPLSSGTLEFLGTGTAGSDYLDFIIQRGKQQDVLPALAEYLVRENALLELAQIKRGDGLAVEFAGQCIEQGWRSWETSINVCPTINLTGHTWDSYLATLGSEHRYNFRRKLKNLSNRFEVRFEMARSEDERKEALTTLVSLHSLRWEERGGSDAFFIPEHVSFHDELSSLALQQGRLRLFTLRLDGRPAASLYGFRYGKVFYFYQSGFDPSFASSSVGLITMGLAIQSAIEEGAEEFDLLHGAEKYKFLWAHETRDLGRLELYPPGLWGFIWKQARAVTRGTKKMARNVLPQRVSEMIAAARRNRNRKGFYVSIPRKDDRLPCLTLDRNG